MTELDDNDAVREIKLCHHMFHRQCLEKWVEVRNTCPLCKVELKLYGVAVLGGRNNEEVIQIVNEQDLDMRVIQRWNGNGFEIPAIIIQHMVRFDLLRSRDNRFSLMSRE